jgi:hypothetical protein
MPRVSGNAKGSARAPELIGDPGDDFVDTTIPGLIGDGGHAQRASGRRMVIDAGIERGKEALAVIGDAHAGGEFLDLGVAHADHGLAGGEVFAQLERIGIGDLAIEPLRNDRDVERTRPVG